MATCSQRDQSVRTGLDTAASSRRVTRPTAPTPPRSSRVYPTTTCNSGSWCRSGTDHQKLNENGCRPIGTSARVLPRLAEQRAIIGDVLPTNNIRLTRRQGFHPPPTVLEPSIT